MHAFEVGDLLATLLEKERGALDAHGVLWSELLRVPALSVGLYLLAAGAYDPQRPHTEDELYYVLDGAGRITVGDEERAVGPGSLIHVPAHLPHRFHTITAPLSVLVFFAPAEGTHAPGSDAGHAA